jgi:acyl-CoA synthetase (NDP forming)
VLAQVTHNVAGDPLEALWAARGVAVIGASPRPDAPGHLAVHFLRRFGYSGRIVPVHPTATVVAEVPAYPSVRAALADGAEPGIDLALIVVPPDAVPAAVDDCVEAGVRVAIVGTSGFGETGDAGRAAQEAIVAAARLGGMRLVGPNCIGAANLWTGQVASFSPLFSGEGTRFTPGGIAFASVSGALGYGTVSLALERGLGLGWAITTGNEADVTTLEVLSALAAQPECIAALGYLEGLSDAAGLRALAKTGKPAALLVAGSSAAGARAAASHTGALTTPDRVVEGALRQLGIVRVSDVDELLDIGDAFALTADAGRWPNGPRIAVLTTSGGSGILAADAVEASGLSLAELSTSTVETLTRVVPAYGSVANPVDVTATVMRDRTLVERCVAALAADPGVDMIVACFCVLVGADVDAIVTALREVAEASGKPVLVARTGAEHLAPDAAAALRRARLPTYQTPARAIRAAAALWRVSRGQGRVSVTSRASVTSRVPVPSEAPISQPLPDATEAELKALLAAAGIPVPVARVVTDPAAASAAVAACGGRAVLKAIAPGMTHKTEMGAVILDVAPPAAAEHATRLLALPGVVGVLVEEQAPTGVEVLVGVAPSPLGPALTIGAGGVLAEALDDVAVRLLPVDADDIREMLSETRLARLLAGFRGGQAANVDALVALVFRLGELVACWPADGALDLNPVRVGPAGAIVLDAAYVAKET